MTLLAVESSSIDYGVALVVDGRVLAERTRRRDSGHPGIGGAAAELMAEAGVPVSGISRLAVDIGPGNLGSVRAGVAYANGLAFALDVRVVGIDALEILARGSAQRSPAEPVLGLRAGGAGNVFAGLFHPDGTVERSFGPLATVVPALGAGLSRLIVAGAYRSEAAAALPDVDVLVGGTTAPRVRELAALAAERDPDDDLCTVTALTEYPTRMTEPHD